MKKNYDVFAWSHGNVLEIYPQIAIHKFFINPNHPLIHKKRRKFAPKCLKVIEEEVANLIKAGVKLVDQRHRRP